MLLLPAGTQLRYGANTVQCVAIVEPIILVAVLFIGVWFYAQQTNTADAPGHCGAGTEEMGNKLSYDEILTLANNAGFGCDSSTAAAIALAESGGDPTAYNPETQACTPDGQGSVGLWQIYQFKHPEFAGQDLTDPQTNANAAYKVYTDAGGFRPWSTFKSGAYQNFLS